MIYDRAGGVSTSYRVDHVRPSGPHEARTRRQRRAGRWICETSEMEQEPSVEPKTIPESCGLGERLPHGRHWCYLRPRRVGDRSTPSCDPERESGRATCRESVCQYV